MDLLADAIKEAEKAGYKIQPMESVRDRIGRIAYRIPDAIVVAREYVWDRTVSIHDYIIKYADQKELTILLYIGRKQKLYALNPYCIIHGDTWVNYRNGECMRNFYLEKAASMSLLYGVRQLPNL